MLHLRSMSYRYDDLYDYTLLETIFTLCGGWWLIFFFMIPEELTRKWNFSVGHIEIASHTIAKINLAKGGIQHATSTKTLAL
jgi:hypothetical protein